MIRLEGVTSGGTLSMVCADDEQAERTMRALDDVCALEIEWSISPLRRSRKRKPLPGSVG
jgi:hypothetical protein